MRANELSIVAAVVVLGLVSLPRAASAQANAVPDHPMMRDGWVVGTGALWSESNVTASLNSGRVGLGTIIDFEDDLGLDETNVIGMAWVRARFLKRWQVEVEYFSLDRDEERQLSRTLDWGDAQFPITATVRSNFDIEDIRVSLGYSLFRTQDKEIGIGLGVHVASLDAGISTRNLGSQRGDVTAPLPFGTLYARMALTDRWLLDLRVDRLSLDTGNIDGKVFSSGFQLVYQPWRHFNIGLGYRDVNFQIASTSDDWRGKAQVQQNGPVLFVSATF